MDKKLNTKIVNPPPTDTSKYDDLDEIFKLRSHTHPTSRTDVLIHLLKAALGTGILAMPKAFSSSGLVMGVFLGIFAAVICAHCSLIVVKCAHELYRRTGRHTMTYFEVAEESFKTGPVPLRRFATFFKYLLAVALFVSYFLILSAYTVIISHNIFSVLKRFQVYVADNDATAIRIIIAILVVPLILISWVPNLRYLTPFSMIANICMGVGLGITVYYLLVGENALQQDDFSYAQHPGEWGEFLSLIIFALMIIGVTMPLENSMKRSQPMLGICGVISQGVSIVTFLYLLLGILGYIRFGSTVEDSITLSLGDAIPAQIVKLMISFAVFCTFALNFFVCLDSIKGYLKQKFTKKPVLMEYVARTILTVLAVVVAAFVPNISVLMGIVGALCFSFVGFLVPVALELVTFWNTPDGLGLLRWILYKNIFIALFGILVMVIGTKSAIITLLHPPADKKLY